MSTRMASLIALAVAVLTVLSFLASYARYQTRAREQFVADLRRCTFSDVLEPILREFFSETNTALLGTAANVYFDGVVKAIFTEYERSDWERTTRAVNDVLKVLLRGVDMVRLFQLLQIVKRCARQEVARIESVALWLSDETYRNRSFVRVGQCVYESLGREVPDREADAPPTLDDLYLMLTIVQRNARIVDTSTDDVPESLRDLVISLRGEIIPRDSFVELVKHTLLGTDP